jgi:uncharacterized C2H2 Zn-finger protein
MNHPLREKLEVYSDQAGAWIRCTRCLSVICRSNDNWRDACTRSLASPIQAGPLMKELVGHFVLEQLYCPGCGALFNTELVEEQKNAQEGRAKQAKA